MIKTSHTEDIPIADLHTHILPYVDDGAYSMTESIALLKTEYAQGVRAVCLTPHYDTGYFAEPEQDTLSGFQKLQLAVSGEDGIPDLYLSREYHASSDVLNHILTESCLPLAQRHILLEFDFRSTLKEMEEAVTLLRQNGWNPLIAHIERYDAVLRTPLESAQMLRKAGALLQVNTDSLLGYEGRYQAQVTQQLLTSDAVYAVGSDTHGVDFRNPEWPAAAEHLVRLLGPDRTRRLVWDNPLRILPASAALHHKD